MLSTTATLTIASASSDSRLNAHKWQSASWSLSGIGLHAPDCKGKQSLPWSSLLA
eukprot:CAMPEP_0171064932 /NCGR_PEP_ID=MMETSP0766_2-20121228/6569_1 /TAXON_ID=439317 /ORGANISM="Gambierdiscus australes, Strain CAWD 149" /LENGTH=54 /DNA_ID=CAMNT_0011521001 /DNA_START=140 /DNA_END=304 /DNA_ORIENTATION=+